MLRLLTVALAVTALAACSAGPAATVSPTSPPPAAPTASPTALATSSPSGSPAGTGPAPLAEGPLDAGRYTTTAFEPTITFSIGEGWRALFQDDSDEVALEGSDGAFFAITRPGQVVDPATGTTATTPDDLTAWLAAHPSFTTTSPQPVVVSGIAGQSLEGLPEGSDVAVFAYPEGNMHFPQGVRVRFHVVPLDGPDMVIVVAAPEGSFAAVADRAQQIVDSLEVTGS